MTHRIVGILFLMMAISAVKAQPLSEEALKQQPVFTSLEEALQNPEQVYRLKLKFKADSMPEEVFQLTNLQELTAARCKMNVLNQNIGKLTHLEYLNVMGNHLVRLPESIGNLIHLKTLVICRNLIEALPESIGNLKKLTYIDAWENPLYVFPESITELQHTLKTIDLRQIDLHNDELDRMEAQLPYTDIKYTSTCDCHDNRNK
ncbi:MAG: leucine-rich repeat domain-containing protein [Bacteroidales bacterium]|nr:leucine-rich repeat domain-containing protein [Bacteroidales bacterium]